MMSKKAPVLIVDDDVRILRMMKRTLELEGYRIHTASNGEAAFDVLDSEAQDNAFLARLAENPAEVLKEYDLTAEEKVAIASGDIRKIEL